MRCRSRHRSLGFLRGSLLILLLWTTDTVVNTTADVAADTATSIATAVVPDVDTQLLGGPPCHKQNKHL